MATVADSDPVPVGFEPVHVELDWYDGPRSGLADVDGAPHYFQGVYDYHPSDEPDDYFDYFVWPANETAVAMEREQWEIFAEWNIRYEAGTATVATHPGHGEINSRYDELVTLLAPHRAMPERTRRLTATWHPGTRRVRYPLDGPIYSVKWRDPNR
jgi:hypothetical protein